MTKHSRSGSFLLLTESEVPQDARYSRQESIEVRPFVPKGFLRFGRLENSLIVFELSVQQKSQSDCYCWKNDKRHDCLAPKRNYVA